MCRPVHRAGQASAPRPRVPGRRWAHRPRSLSANPRAALTPVLLHVLRVLPTNHILAPFKLNASRHPPQGSSLEPVGLFLVRESTPNSSGDAVRAWGRLEEADLPPRHPGSAVSTPAPNSRLAYPAQLTRPCDSSHQTGLSQLGEPETSKAPFASPLPPVPLSEPVSTPRFPRSPITSLESHGGPVATCLLPPPGPVLPRSTPVASQARSQVTVGLGHLGPRLSSACPLSFRS